MNELEIIRHQIATERQHVAEVASVCAKLIDANALQGTAAEASLEYLAFALTRLEAAPAREGLAKLDVARGAIASKGAAEATGSPATWGSAAIRGSAGTQGSPAITGSAGPQDSALHWRDFLQFFEAQWRKHLDVLDAATSRTLHIKEWRAIAKIDADSIYEERKRYGRVKAAGL